MGFFGKIVGKAVNDAIYKASDGKKMVSTDYSKAAINIIKRRIENITLFVNIFATIVFLGFYAFMIYSNHTSVVSIVIYSILAFLLIVSTILDIIIFMASRKEMNFLEKRTFALYKKVKRNSLLIFKTVIKLFSIGYAIFIIATDGQTTGRIISIAASVIALLIQLGIHYLACFITDCINYMVVGVTQDVDNSGILFLVDKNKQAKNVTNEMLRTKSDKKILEELEKQKEKDSIVKSEDDEIKIKYGKYQLECKEKAVTLKLDEKKLNETIKNAFTKYERTSKDNDTPVEVFYVINLVEAYLDKRFREINEESYLCAIAFVVYYNTLYDTSKDFKSTNEPFILNKIFTDIKGLEEFIVWFTKNK